MTIIHFIYWPYFKVLKLYAGYFLLIINHAYSSLLQDTVFVCVLYISKQPSEDAVASKSCFQKAEETLSVICPDKVPLAALGLCCCTILLHSIQSRRLLVCLQTGPVSTWKWYKSTVVQEASAISSLLRHKRITVPLTQTTTTWDPVQHWNFPTDKNTLTVQSYELTGSLGRAVAVIPSMNESLLSSTCRVFTGTNKVQCLSKSDLLLSLLHLLRFKKI